MTTDSEADYPVRLAVRDAQIAAPILARVLAMMAARAGLSVDRISDVVLASDLLAKAATYSRDGACDVEIRAQSGCVGLRLSGFDVGVAARVFDGVRIEGVAALRRLADAVGVETRADHERMTLAFCTAAGRAAYPT